VSAHVAELTPAPTPTPLPSPAAQTARRAVKRGIDIVVSGIALLILLPLGLLIALLVVLESPGPVFYLAERVGFRGRPLMMLKFRKMHADAGGSALTIANDSRFTRIGALLARTRLDELPQLWHVLGGEMSLVGPRPESPGFVSCRAEDYERILTVRPGLTGWSQLAFAAEQEILQQDSAHEYYVTRLLPQKTVIDRLYAQDISLRRDLRIMFWTAVALGLRQPIAINRRTGEITLRRRPAAPMPQASAPHAAPAPSADAVRHEAAA
jgi:lipopolysaccharide/colanic/teichoic acid biosynthesis glycosyltransferase